MQTVDIYRGADLFVTIKPDADSSQTKAIMGENVIRLAFDDNRHIKFQINDWCTVFGEKYILMGIPSITKFSQFRYRYIVEMKAEGALLSRYQYLFLGDDNSLKETDFSLMGNTNTFMNLLLQNLHRNDTEWKLGEITPSGYKNITFSDNCYNALVRIAEEFETEFYFVGKTIHLGKRSKDTGYSYKHGKNLGLREITPQPVEGGGVVTRLLAFGSEKNLPSDYRNFSRRLRMTDGELYIEQNTDLYGVIEYTQIFDDIFPNRTGKVTGVDALDPFSFTDSSIDFNINDYLLPGTAAKVTFNTGQLKGYTFDIRSFDWPTKEVVILLNKDERAIEVPSALLKPAIGDEYVLVDITLPEPYIIAAEAALTEAAATLLNQISVPQEKYSIVFDPTYLRRKNQFPAIGDLIWITDANFEIERKIRVTSTTRKIVNEWELSVELADTISYGRIDVIINMQNSNARDIIDIEKYLENNSTLNNNVIGDLNIKQGTAKIQDIPTTSTMVGYSELVIDNSTGRLFKKI